MAWSCITVVVIGLAVLWPLQALRSPMVLYDGFAIWTLHSLFIYGGHGVYRQRLDESRAPLPDPNYPPLVPATGALGFVAQGGVDLRLAGEIHDRAAQCVRPGCSGLRHRRDNGRCHPASASSSRACLLPEPASV